MASTNLGKSSGSVLTAAEVNTLLKVTSDQAGIGTETVGSYVLVLNSSSAEAILSLEQSGNELFSFSGPDSGSAGRLDIKDNGGTARAIFDCRRSGSRNFELSPLTSFIVNTGASANNRLIVDISGHTKPGADNSYTCGTSGNRWSDIYAVSGSVNTSDAREKENIEDLSKGLEFVKKLRPVEFNFTHGKRTHFGFLAQDLEKIIADTGEDFAAFVKAYYEEENIVEQDEEGNDIVETIEKYRLGIRYSELIAPLVKAFQEAYVDFDNRLNILEGK